MTQQLLRTVGLLVLGGALSLSLLPMVQAQVGPTTSLGAQPYASFSGDVTSVNTSILVAPSDSTFLITDVIITQTESTAGFCGGLVILYADSTPIGQFRIASSVDGNAGWGQGLINHSFASGLPVEAGQSLSVQSQSFSCANVSYTIAGRYIHS